MSDDNKFYAMVFSKNIATLLCFTVLSIYFNHWWIVFFFCNILVMSKRQKIIGTTPARICCKIEVGGREDMARLHKVSMFVLDVNEDYESISDLIEYAFDRTEASAHFVEAKTAEFPWYDDIILNRGNSTKQDYEDFMDKSARREKEIRVMVDGKFDELKESIKNMLSSAGISDTDKNVLEFMKQMGAETECRIEEDNPNTDYGDFVLVGDCEQGGYKCPKCGYVNNMYVDGKTCPSCGYGKGKK